MSVPTITINGTMPCNWAYMESATVTLRAGGPDSFSCSFGAEAAESDTPPFSWNDSVVVVVDSETIFSGRIVTPNVAAGDVSEGFAYEAENGWGDMEKVTLEQSVKSYDPDANSGDGGLVSVDIPVVTLGQNASGEHTKTGAVFSKIISWAASKSANITAGNIIAGRLVNQTQVSDQKCAPVLRNYLSFHPDSTAWISNGNELNIQPTDALSTVSFSVNDDAVICDATSREDRAIQGVKIVYKIADEFDGVTKIRYEIDSAGNLDTWPPPVVMMIEMPGVKVTYQKQRMKTRTLPDASDLSSDATKRFFQGLFPFLSDADLNDIAVKDLVVTAVNPRLDNIDPDTGEIIAGGEANADYEAPTVDDFSKMVIEGAVQDWMAPLEQHPAMLSATVFYRGTDEKILRQMPTLGPEDAGSRYRQKTVQKVVDITDALSKTYKEVESVEGQSSQPLDGLAADYLAEVSKVQYEGTVRGDAAVAPKLLTARPGKRVKVSNLVPNASPVTDWSMDLFSLAVSARFGLSHYLNPRDVIAMNNAVNANPPQWSTTGERTEALPEAGSGSVGGNTGGGGGNFGGGEVPQVAPKAPWDLIDATDWTAANPVAKVDLIEGRLLASFDRLSMITIDTSLASPKAIAVGESIYIELEFDLSTIAVTDAHVKCGDISATETAEFNDDDKLVKTVTELWRFVAPDEAAFLKMDGLILPGMKAVRMNSAAGDLRVADVETLIDNDVRMIKLLVPA